MSEKKSSGTAFLHLGGGKYINLNTVAEIEARDVTPEVSGPEGHNPGGLDVSNQLSIITIVGNTRSHLGFAFADKKERDEALERLLDVVAVVHLYERK